MVDVFVDKPQIRMSVAYMVIGESDLQKIGNPVAADSTGAGVLHPVGAFTTIQNLLHGGGNHGNYAQIGVGLDVMARFFKNNGISRISDTGYTVMESWSEKGAKFKSGGTLYVRQFESSGNTGGSSVMVGNLEMKEIPYGFDIKTKGGLVDGNSVDVDFDFSMSGFFFPR